MGNFIRLTHSAQRFIKAVFQLSVSHVGLEPTLAGLESAAQPLYQWPKYKHYIIYWYNKFKLCGANWESNPIFLGSLPSVISYLIKNSVSRSYLKTIILTNAHYNLSLCDLWIQRSACIMPQLVILIA